MRRSLQVNVAMRGLFYVVALQIASLVAKTVLAKRVCFESEVERLLVWFTLDSPMSLNCLEFEGDGTLSKGGKANPAPADKKE